MDQKSLHALEALCTNEEPPPCQAGCPLGLDVRGFHKEMAAANLDAARKILEKWMPMASIVAGICESPCQTGCHRVDLGGAINTAGLERFCVENSTLKGRSLPLPPKNKNIAIWGSGLDSLTVAHDLAKKGYSTTVFYKGHCGGKLCEIVDQNRIDQEIKKLEGMKILFKEVETFEKHERYHAFFIGEENYDSKKDGTVDTLTGFIADNTFASPFMGSKTPIIDAVAGGRQAALSIDRFLQNVSLTADRPSLRRGRTALFVNTEGIEAIVPVAPTNGTYSLEDAQAEAGRCIHCECLECVKKCVFLQEYKGYPKTYARKIYNNSAIVKGNHQANKMINSCSLCRQCEVVCPNGFSMTDLCLESRQLMVAEKRMPPSAGHFALEEMYAAQTETKLLLHGPEQSTSTAIFFPGCQLGGIRPLQTEQLYKALLKKNPQTGIWLDCCAAPLYWGGQENNFAEFVERFLDEWRVMGNPTIITACSSCAYVFEQVFPQACKRELPTVVSAWSLIDALEGSDNRGTLAVSDPCTARHNKQVQERVRALVRASGYQLAPLEHSGEWTECCGFGGMMESTNPQLTAKVLAHRAAQTDAPILSYCAMCRDQIAKTGKESVHILDLLFPEIAIPMDQAPISLSARRINRRKLQISLEEHAGVPVTAAPEWTGVKIEIAPEVEDKIHLRAILRDDIQKTLFYGPQKPQKRIFHHPKSGKTICACLLGRVTYWVEYTKIADSYRIHNAWSHRMSVEGVTE